jgi:hypothetical protein
MNSTTSPGPRDGYHYNPQLNAWVPPFVKEAHQSDNLSDQAGRALQYLSAVIVEYPNDASLKQMLDSFLRALSRYTATINEDPASAARRFGEEIENIIHERQMGQAMRSSLQKGMSAFEFWKR